MSIDVSNFYHLRVPGDGDCLFHSLSEILHLENNIKKHGSHVYTFRNKNHQNATKLRKDVVTWMEQNINKVVKGSVESIQTSIEDAVQNEPKKYKNVTTYLQKMKQPGEYGGQPEIYAFSELFKKNVKTYVL